MQHELIAVAKQKTQEIPDALNKIGFMAHAVSTHPLSASLHFFLWQIVQFTNMIKRNQAKHSIPKLCLVSCQQKKKKYIKANKRMIQNIDVTSLCP